MIVKDLFKDCDRLAVFDKMFEMFDERLKQKYSKNKNLYYQRLNESVDDILKLEPIETDGFIYVSEVFDFDEETYLGTSIVRTEDIVKNKDYIYNMCKNFDINIYKEKFLEITNYSLMYVPREELISYNFAENSFNIYDKNKVIASVLFELTFFGYSNEENKKNIEKDSKYLTESNKEFEEGKTLSFDDLMKEEYGENWEDMEEFKYVPPTEEEINENILKNMKPIYEEFKWILEHLN